MSFSAGKLVSPRLIKRGLSVVRARRGTSTLEVVVAIALLAAATTLVGGFVHQVKAGLRDRELSSRCNWELMNARERIGSWPVGQITLEQIQQISISKSLTDRVASAHLAATIQQIEKPVPAKQVTLAIECELDGQTVQPSVVTFWVPVSTEGNP
jgi:hypothetical protein